MKLHQIQNSNGSNNAQTLTVFTVRHFTAGTVFAIELPQMEGTDYVVVYHLATNAHVGTHVRAIGVGDVHHIGLGAEEEKVFAERIYTLHLAPLQIR